MRPISRNKEEKKRKETEESTKRNQKLNDGVRALSSHKCGLGSNPGVDVIHMMAFCAEHPKCDQNPKFTPLSETTSIPTPFICGVPPAPGFEKSRSRLLKKSKYFYKIQFLVKE